VLFDQADLPCSLVCGTACLAADPFKVVEPPDAELLMTMRVAGRGVHATAIRSMSFLPGGGGGGGGGEDSLLVFGGQGGGEPDMLTALPLAPQPAGEGGGRQVPWFGNIKGLCTVSSQACAACLLTPEPSLLPRAFLPRPEAQCCGPLVEHCLRPCRRCLGQWRAAQQSSRRAS
jgi:hypothetical protein